MGSDEAGDSQGQASTRSSIPNRNATVEGVVGNGARVVCLIELITKYRVELNQ
jgi:hypothetical protein